jgi:WD40 repeat protein
VGHHFVFITVVLQGVTALACTSDSGRVVSGGGEGQVRIWDVTPRGHNMKEALKEHKGAVTCIKIRRSDQEVKLHVKVLYNLCSM